MTGITYKRFVVLDNFINKHVKKGHQTNAMNPKQRLRLLIVTIDCGFRLCSQM